MKAKRVGLGELEGAVATAGGNRAVSPHRSRPCYNPLKAEHGFECAPR
jgi:hypothetical protein